MVVEQIATSNNGQKEAPKNVVNSKETDVSNKIDYKLNKIDEEKFKEFKKMADYIEKNGWEYREEYKKIMDERIKPFEKQLQDILNKSNENVTEENLDKKSDEEIAKEADKRMKNQPEEFKQQTELIKKINWNGSPEEIQKLNEIVNNNMTDVQNFYEKIINKKAD